MKKGDILYYAWTSIDSARNETSTLEIDEYHVTKIDARGVYLIEKNSVTWVKLSKSHYDYGWAKTIDHYYRKHIKINETAKDVGLFKTKKAACKDSLKYLKKKRGQISRIITRIEKM